MVAGAESYYERSDGERILKLLAVKLAVIVGRDVAHRLKTPRSHWCAPLAQMDRAQDS